MEAIWTVERVPPTTAYQTCALATKREDALK